MRSSPLQSAFLLTAGCAAASDEAVLYLGNPLRPWTGAEGLIPDEQGDLIFDTSICFSGAGTVRAVSAHMEESRPIGTWPDFYVLQPRGGTFWLIGATTDISQAVGWAPTHLSFQRPLLVQPGDCLGWHTNRSNGLHIASITTWQQPGEPPLMTSKAATAISAGAIIEDRPNIGDVFDFKQIRHAMYSLQAEFLPEPTGFMQAALTRLEHGPTKQRHWTETVSGLSTEQMKTLCWPHGYTFAPRDCCVPSGQGRRFCFAFTKNIKLFHEDCCTEEIVGPAVAWTPKHAEHFLHSNFRLVDPRTGTPSALSDSDVTVDLFVRTAHKKRHELDLLIESVAIFWPAQWGVIVALDATEADDALCKSMPPWVKCISIDKPPFYEEMRNTPGAQPLGMLEKEWSECWADRHSSADFIAIIDSDIVFTSFVLPQLLFQAGPKPIIMGHASHRLFVATVSALRIEWVAEFMDNFPLLIRRSHFRRLRDYIIRVYKAEESSLDPFDAAFMPFVKRVIREGVKMKKQPEVMCFHSMMGTFLYHFHRDSYVWSIRYGHLTSVSPRHTCPRLRVAHHVSYWGLQNWMAQYGYPFKQLKFGTTPAMVSDAAYRSRASALVLAGMCAVRWVRPEGGSPGHLLNEDGQRRPLLIDVNSTWEPVGPGLQDVQYDLCSRGTGLAEGNAAIEDRLLGHTFPAERWTELEAAHCGPHTPRRLLLQYRKLMALHVFIP
eukprot:TRINITY_DN112136_c0_g1_i1.p1 TRINITY_DN112136_c0_g1~~TRINITY_DN112136_c0_g1_i1.p1  ORF type:complete len:719 (+),score=26.47 TRINITY_DN112136_c0_g1_i1:221-2377(+)